MYRPSVSDELQKFFDFYCKPCTGNKASWESPTPRVRLSVLGFEADGSSATTVVERPERSHPLTRQRLRTLYLDGITGTPVDLEPNQESINSYEGRSLSNGLVSLGHLKNIHGTQRMPDLYS